jgi:hypothetical protein
VRIFVAVIIIMIIFASIIPVILTNYGGGSASASAPPPPPPISLSAKLMQATHEIYRRPAPVVVSRRFGGYGGTP